MPLFDLLPGVLIPKMVNIGICEGQCTYASQGNPSYADLLSLHYHNNEFEGSAIPERCGCVPTSFNNLTLLAKHNASGLIYVKQLPIAVASCACL